MRIGDSPPPKKPLATMQASKLEAASAQPTVQSDKLAVLAPPVKVVTYNTGSDDASHAPQGEYTDLPVFQDVIQGKPDAPIISLQEVGPELGKKLEVLAKQTGNFQVVWTGKNWLPNQLALSPFTGANLVIVPKRFQLEHAEKHTYKGRLSQLWDNFKGWAFHHKPANDMLLAVQDRGYETLRLKDTRSGKAFDVINSHVSFYDPTRRREAPQLAEAIRQAEAEGPVIVTGDFNTPTLESARDPNDPGIQAFWKTLAPADLQDMGPTGAAGASNWHNGEDIDHVLAHGFTSEAAHMYRGTEMSLPGYPDAQRLSDHYAEGDTLAFDP